MSFDELIYRLRNRFDEYWHSEKRSVKFISRLLAFTLFAAVVSTIAPTLADELSSDPQMLQPVAQSSDSSTVSISDTSTVSPAPLASFTPDVVIARPSISASNDAPLPESSDSATAQGPGKPLEIQPKYVIKVPPSGAIDPRASKYFLPHIYAGVSDSSVDYSMACISGSAGMRFDAIQKDNADNADRGKELVFGDQSGLLIISAETNRVVNLINSYNGLLASSSGGGLSGRTITLRFVAVTKPVTDPNFCSAAKSGAVMTLRPLGLEISTVKGGGRLK